MDWRNKLPNIQNKVKFQLHAKKIDDLESLYKLIKVYYIKYLKKSFFNLSRIVIQIIQDIQTKQNLLNF